MNQHRGSLDRRSFLKGTAASSLAFAFPMASSLSALEKNAKAPPSEQIRIGCIGVGGQGRGIMGRHIKNVVAVCDVDSERRGQAKDRVEKARKGTCAEYGDYRKLLDDKSIDAVLVATPDHWHALVSVDACFAGKDVYCEKPLTLTIDEGKAMVKAARENKRIVQTGSQQRSDGRFRQACELVRNGKIGKIKRVLVGIPGVNFKGPPVPDSQPPEVLDYDFWLGPTPKKPYNAKHVHYNFRFFWDYSGGQITNWGAHHLDITQWGLGMDESGPISIQGKAKFHPQNWYEVPMWFDVTYKYANGTVVQCGQEYRQGATFEGEDGTIFVTRGKIEATPKEVLKTKLGDEDVRLYASNNHANNWLECIRSRKLPICDVAIGHRSATVCHLGNIAIRSGRTIAWDPVKQQVVGDSKAAAMQSRPYRSPWELRS